MNRLKITALICAAALSLGACSPRTDFSSYEYTQISRPDVSQPVEASTLDFISGGSKPDVSTLLQENPANGAQSLAGTIASYQKFDLSFPQTFAVTRPTEAITTTFSSYFITGTSDPGKPVYYSGNEITRQGSKGLFGVLVNLSIGTNTFTFSQDDKSTTVTITRTSAGISKISGLVQSSVYPSVTGSAKAGEELSVACTAPSGATVKASFGGKSTVLSQVETAGDGLPAAFRGNIPIGTDYTEGQTTNAGKVTYTMTYGGVTKNYESSGNVYIAGTGSRLAVKVSGYIGFVTENNDPSEYYHYVERLKKGAVDYIEGQDNDYYKLSSGGYLPTSAAGILEGEVNIKNELSKTAFTSGSNYEQYTFYGTENPVYLTKADDSSFSLTLYNTSGTPDIDTSGSKVFSSVATTVGGNRINFTFTKKNTGNLWGYNLSYDGSNTVLRIAYKPSVSGGSQPLSGVTIVLDPGHGNYDSGALGVAGKSGPDENTINLAHALAAKAALEEKGAAILLTRSSTGEFLTLDERLEFFEKSGADMFLAIHHNSLVESADANSVSGVEVYYNSSLSKNVADRLLSGLSSGLGRTQRTIEQSYYRVTMIPYAPSVLCELGYMCNPLEYEKLTNQSEIEKAAKALADSVVAALS